MCPSCLPSAAEARGSKTVALLNIHAENAADLGHGTVHTAGQAAHSCCRSKGHQSDNQHILHNPLTGFVFVKANYGILKLVYHFYLYCPLGYMILCSLVSRFWLCALHI